jgi:hypothetical protein
MNVLSLQKLVIEQPEHLPAALSTWTTTTSTTSITTLASHAH